MLIKIAILLIELKSESKHLISDYLGSLKNVCKSFKKFFGISVSHQTIENLLFVNEKILEFDLVVVRVIMSLMLNGLKSIKNGNITIPYWILFPIVS